MTDIATIPTPELIRDKMWAKHDLKIAQMALKYGVTTYGDNKSVQERLDGNLQLIEIIEQEIKRRKKVAVA